MDFRQSNHEGVLVDWLHVVEVWVGANFLFGHDRAGNFTLLRTLGALTGALLAVAFILCPVTAPITPPGQESSI